MSSQEVFKAGERAMQEARWEDAVQMFGRVSQQDPNYADALYYKAQALSNAGHFDDAIVAFDRAIQRVGHGTNYEADILVSKGDALIEMDRLADAEACYDRALSIKPRLARAWVHKARIEARRKHYQQSADYCDRALALDPKEYRAWNNKAFALCQLGRFDECIRCAKEAIKLKPDYTMAYYHMARAYEAKGDPRRARKYDEQFQQLIQRQRGMMLERMVGQKPVHPSPPRKKRWPFWR
ncbi:MAG: tetratricopeptide repeat protein [Rhodothermales bacterium]